MAVVEHDRGDEVIIDGDDFICSCFNLITSVVLFCRKVISFIGASEKSAYSNVLILSMSSKIKTSTEPKRIERIVLKLGDGLTSFSWNSSP